MPGPGAPLNTHSSPGWARLVKPGLPQVEGIRKGRQCHQTRHGRGWKMRPWLAASGFPWAPCGRREPGPDHVPQASQMGTTWHLCLPACQAKAPIHRVYSRAPGSRSNSVIPSTLAHLSQHTKMAVALETLEATSSHLASTRHRDTAPSYQLCHSHSCPLCRAGESAGGQAHAPLT